MIRAYVVVDVVQWVQYIQYMYEQPMIYKYPLIKYEHF